MPVEEWYRYSRIVRGSTERRENRRDLQKFNSTAAFARELKISQRKLLKSINRVIQGEAQAEVRPREAERAKKV